MKNFKGNLILALLASMITLSAAPALAQETTVILSGPDLTRVVPTSFYFQGMSASTQMRNSTAARFGDKRYVVVGLVDTSGYAADVRAKYEGFFITDSPIKINGSDLSTGAYGFGFSDDGKMQILDLAGNEILSVTTAKDAELRRPRPLMMSKSGDGVRLYNGKDYVTLTAK
jgi:hypothetical protein